MKALRKESNQNKAKHLKEMQDKDVYYEGIIAELTKNEEQRE